MNLSKWLFSFIFVFLVVGCSKTESNKTPVARLDNQTLSLEEIRAQIDTTRELSMAQIQQYIQRWLTEETLYREAIVRGLDQTDEINKKIEEIKRQLAINALLDKEVYSQESMNFSKEDIQQYYVTHTKEFNVTSDAALVSYVLFKNRDAASEFRNLVLKGNTWNSTLDQKATSIVLRVDSTYQTQSSLIPSELWRVASNAAAQELSFPINTNNGYYIITVWKYIKQGQTADLPLVEKEIRGRLTIEKRRMLFDQLVQKLRAKHAIEVFVDSAIVSNKTKSEY